jgi:hypothetical protein
MALAAHIIDLALENAAFLRILLPLQSTGTPRASLQRNQRE